MTAVLAIACAACGKKGPPLAPIVHIPAAVEQISARRSGNDVSLTVTVPTKNIDGTMPVDISRIDIYGYTGNVAPPRARFLEVATLVGTITVPEQKPDAPPSAAPPPGTPVPGGKTTIVDSLKPDALIAKPIPPAPSGGRNAARTPPAIPTATAPVDIGPLRRFYLALSFSPRGRPGPPGTIAELPLTLLPDPPSGVKAVNTPGAVRLEWEPSGGLIGFLLERTLAPELSPFDSPLPQSATDAPVAVPLKGPTRYNVYREIAALDTANGRGAADSKTQPASPKPTAEPAPAAINATPLDTLTFTDPLGLLDGRKRCYVVRSVRGDGAQAVEGLPSDPECLVPVDDVAPEPPMGLTATVGDGEITLEWEPNVEPDVAGYLILRGEAGDATLNPVTDTVVTETRYTDRTVKPGVSYVYAVKAIDSHLPRPNVSTESARAAAVAR